MHTKKWESKKEVPSQRWYIILATTGELGSIWLPKSMTNQQSCVLESLQRPTVQRWLLGSNVSRANRNLECTYHCLYHCPCLQCHRWFFLWIMASKTSDKTGDLPGNWAMRPHQYSLLRGPQTRGLGCGRKLRRRVQGNNEGLLKWVLFRRSASGGLIVGLMLGSSKDRYKMRKEKNVGSKEKFISKIITFTILLRSN